VDLVKTNKITHDDEPGYAASARAWTRGRIRDIVDLENEDDD
jgi:hypothetical protein